MFCHIIPDEKFTKRVVEFFEEKYNKGENIFIVYNEGRYFYDGDFENVIMCNFNSENINKLLPIMKQSDKIFIHGFGARQIVNFFNKYKYLMKKAVVIIWGGDLYNDHIFLKRHIGLCLRLRYFMHKKKNIIKRAPYFMTFTYSDYDYAHLWLKANGIQFDCLYPSNLNITELNKIENEYIKNKNNDIINILVGNSATDTNNHFEAFEALKRFKNNNIRVYCPLSYGDKSYGLLVEHEGKRLFGDKFVAVKDYMNINDYSRFLALMDIAFFIYDRQQATANLEILGYFGSKVYLKSTCALWEHYVQRDGCSFYSFEKVREMNFNQMIAFSEQEKKNNKSYFSNIWDDNYIKSLWDKVLYYEE